MLPWGEKRAGGSLSMHVALWGVWHDILEKICFDDSLEIFVSHTKCTACLHTQFPAASMSWGWDFAHFTFITSDYLKDTKLHNFLPDSLHLTHTHTAWHRGKSTQIQHIDLFLPLLSKLPIWIINKISGFYKRSFYHSCKLIMYSTHDTEKRKSWDTYNFQKYLQRKLPWIFGTRE